MTTKHSQLRLDFTATHCRGWPRLNFYFDNDLYQDFEFSSSQDSVTLCLDFLPGQHELAIELHGKTTENTMIENGLITQDQTVRLDRMWVDDVDLPAHFLYHGKYMVKDNLLGPILHWGMCNAKWVWNFECPIIDWILDEKHRQIPLEHNHEFSRLYSSAKNQRILAALDKLEKKINDIDF